MGKSFVIVFIILAVFSLLGLISTAVFAQAHWITVLYIILFFWNAGMAISSHVLNKY